MADLRPALIADNDWIWRWQYADADHYQYLHRIAAPFVVDGEPWEAHDATAVCGIADRFEVPGVISRMGRPRCPRCCELIGIPCGDGAPWNETSASWKTQ